MEPVTHCLTGACLARSFGLHRRLRYATATAAIAAELPDIDFVYRAGGPLVYFQNHRGWTHTLLGLPIMAALTLAIVWLWNRGRSRKPLPPNLANLPLHWPALAAIAAVALLSHLLLDWTTTTACALSHPSTITGTRASSSSSLSRCSSSHSCSVSSCPRSYATSQKIAKT